MLTILPGNLNLGLEAVWARAIFLQTGARPAVIRFRTPRIRNRPVLPLCSAHSFCSSKRVRPRGLVSTSQSLSEIFNPKRNAFAFLRCALAVLVIIGHCYPLGGFGADFLEIGYFAIVSFFVLSGFLITRAAANAPSIGRFLWHRFLRIVPGYWVCLIVCAFVIAPIICRIEHGVILPLFLTEQPPQSYVGSNLLLFHTNALSIAGVLNMQPYAIGGLLQSNPYPNIFNGSLWSLPYEVSFYLIVATIAAWGLFLRRELLLAGFTLLWILHAFEWFAPAEFSRCFPYRCFSLFIMLSVYFAAGSLCFLYRKEIRFTRWSVMAALIVVLASPALGCIQLIAPVAVPYAFLWLACKLPITRFDARGDFSYGLYIYAFPVQQVLALLGVQAGGFGLFAVWSVMLATIFGVLSYRFIESPCLRLKSLRLPFTSDRFLEHVDCPVRRLKRAG